MVAQIVVARMLMLHREGRRPTLSQLREVVQAPGLILALARLTGLTLLWMMLGFVSAAIVFVFGFVVKALLFGTRHHGTTMPPPHGWVFSYVLLSFVLGAAFVARYSFVFPLFAAELRGSRELLRHGVALAKQSLGWLRMTNALEYAVVIGFSHLLRPLEKDGSLRAVAVEGISLLVSSVITTCFELLKAELAFTAQG